MSSSQCGLQGEVMAVAAVGVACSEMSVTCT